MPTHQAASVLRERLAEEAVVRHSLDRDSCRTRTTRMRRCDVEYRNLCEELHWCFPECFLQTGCWSVVRLFERDGIFLVLKVLVTVWNLQPVWVPKL